MIILSVCDGIDAGAAVIRDGMIASAVNEERFSRIKLHMGDIHGFPVNSIREALRVAGTSPEEIDRVYLPVNVNTFPFSLVNRFMINRKGGKARWMPASNTLKYLTEQAYARLILNAKSRGYRGRLHTALSRIGLSRQLRKLGINAPVRFVDHHESHAASAYYTSGLDRPLIFTMDSWGDGVSSSVSVGENGKMKKIQEVDALDTVGDFYSMITVFLGFKYHRHEGKITGLAAYGNPGKCYRMLSGAIHFDDKEKIPRNSWGIRSRMIRKFQRIGLSSFSREDVSAATQKIFEEVIVKYVDYYARKTGIRNVCLAGGIFANVKLNQFIHELESVDSVYIFPHMGDGGLSVGAGLLGYAKEVGFNEIPKLDHVYLGPEYSDNDIREALERSGVKYKRFRNIEKETAKLISMGKVVARYNGRMEFGPRALGNRSILYQATDPAVNDWLNNRLGRTEFMPFAPVTLREHMKNSFNGASGAEHTSKFMTITFSCSLKMRKESPAVVHVDGTARPQVIDRETNESYYGILEEYQRMTGLSTIVNTSFNMHEEPIVCTPDDSIRSFLRGHLDALSIGNYLVINHEK